MSLCLCFRAPEDAHQGRPTSTGSKISARPKPAKEMSPSARRSILVWADLKASVIVFAPLLGGQKHNRLPGRLPLARLNDVVVVVVCKAGKSEDVRRMQSDGMRQVRRLRSGGRHLGL